MFTYNVKFSWQCNCVPISRIHVNAFITDNNMVTNNYKSIAMGYELVYLYTKCTSEWICNKKLKHRKIGFRLVYWLHLNFIAKDNEKHHNLYRNKNNLKFVHCISKCKIKQYFFFH